MPANTSKHVHTESAHKCQGHENEESIQHKATAKKASAKAQKDHHDEAKEDNLLIECNGKSDKLSKLQALNLWLTSDNKCMHAQLTHCNELDHPKPCQMIPEPAKLSEKDIKIIHMYLWLVGKEHDFEWFGYWSDACQLLTTGGLNWHKHWAKQDVCHQCTIITALENCHPKLKDFENHWGAIYILQECYNNILNYQKKSFLPGDTDSSSANSTLSNSSPKNQQPATPAPKLNQTQPMSDDDEETCACKMEYLKAALKWSVKWKAVKLKARADLKAAKVLQLDSATNDGETEPEDIPEDVQRIIEQEEVGVPRGSNIPLKPVLKLKHHQVDQDNTPNKSTAVNLQAKHQAVVQAKYGGKGVSSGSHASCIATQDPDEDELLVTSRETSSSSDDD
ncbi:hypothetical protein OPQ81_008138 [Rhizoctonia solani]|nr:hypothetical protein OPQ81_008138 [Rhizoctonia solani]